MRRGEGVPARRHGAHQRPGGRPRRAQPLRLRRRRHDDDAQDAARPALRHDLLPARRPHHRQAGPRRPLRPGTARQSGAVRLYPLGSRTRPPSFTEFLSGFFLPFFSVVTGYYWVLKEGYWVLLGFNRDLVTGSNWFSLRSYWVLLGLKRELLGFPGFYWVLKESYWV